MSDLPQAGSDTPLRTNEKKIKKCIEYEQHEQISLITFGGVMDNRTVEQLPERRLVGMSTPVPDNC
jgi:hypothetical protein